MELGRLIARRMGELAIDSQTEAATLLGVSQSTLTRWVGGSVVPSDGAVPTLAEFLVMPEQRVAELLYKDRREKLLAKQRARVEGMQRALVEAAEMARGAALEALEETHEPPDPADVAARLTQVEGRLTRLEEKVDQLLADG